jgi:hypothetical protein
MSQIDQSELSLEEFFDLIYTGNCKYYRSGHITAISLTFELDRKWH